MNTLTISNLSKTYANGVKALDDINLTITNGMFGLLGANGAGKSSLMRTIATLQEPSEGTLTFNHIDGLEEPDEIRKCLGYLPQEFGVYPKLSAERLLNHLAVLKGLIDSKERKNQVTALLQKVNLYEQRKQAVSTFSGGMKQRFGIAQALLGNPKLIIVDEPTAGLDPEERHRFLNLLSEIGEQVIVILSTHIVEDIKDLCPNMAILSKGKIIAQGQPVKFIEYLQGKIWTKIIPKSELETYKRSHRVISTKLVLGETQIRVWAEEQPDFTFELVAPTLEDFYFTTLSNQYSKPE